MAAAAEDDKDMDRGIPRAPSGDRSVLGDGKDAKTLGFAASVQDT